MKSLEDQAIDALMGGARNGQVIFKGNETDEIVLTTCFDTPGGQECTNKALIDGVWHYVDPGTRFRGDYKEVYRKVPWELLSRIEQSYELSWDMDRPDRRPSRSNPRRSTTTVSPPICARSAQRSGSSRRRRRRDRSRSV